MIQKAILALIALLAIFLVGWLAGLSRHHPSVPEAPPRIHDTATILRQIQTVSQLVTVQYVLEKLVVLDDPKWYGNNRVILVAHGVARAGIDLSGLQPGDIEVNGERILVRLPPAAVIDVYLDESKTHVLERTTSIMRPFDKDLEQEARRQAVHDLRRTAAETGILRDAEDRARMQIAHLTRQLGFREIEFLPTVTTGRFETESR